MKKFVNLAPLVNINNIYYPEIRLSKDSILRIEYPINISCSGQNGLSHKGIGGHFCFWFTKGKLIYKISFTKDKIIFTCLNTRMETAWEKLYNYIKLTQFINQVNKDKSLLYDWLFLPKIFVCFKLNPFILF